MSEANPSVVFFEKTIYLNEVYFICYPDPQMKKEVNKEDLDEAGKKKKYQEYYAIKTWPDKLGYKAIAELDPRMNPNVLPCTGRVLVEFCSRGFLPQFDKFFERTRKVTLLPIDGYEFFLRNSYMMRNKK